MININSIPISDIYFTADTHFGHTNMLDLQRSEFSSIGEHDEYLIEQWNSVVQKDDMIFHLADFTLGDQAAKYFERLNGRIHILGIDWHHDRRWIAREVGNKQIVSRSGWDVQILPPMEVIRTHDLMNGQYPMLITLTHYPLAEWEAKHYGSWMVHGHSHGNYYGEGPCMDVGCDNNNYMPISLYEVKQVIEAKTGGR